MSGRRPHEFGEAPAGPAVWTSLEDRSGGAEEPRPQAEQGEPDVPTKDAHEQGGSFVPASSLSRRNFLAVAGAGTAAVGFQGCIRRPKENILPFTEGPEHVIPGVPLRFATATHRRGDAIGLLVTSHGGRPTKIEGNPQHPASEGATDVFGQATVLDLYDPQRSAGPAKRKGQALVDAKPDEFDKALEARLADHEADGGSGLRILAEPTNSPTWLRMREAVKKRFPNAKFHTYGSVHEGNVRQGARMAFGEPVHAVPDLAQARTVLALDSDFLMTEPGAVRNSRGFAQNRAPQSPRDQMSRLYAVEATMSVTGANADHRLRLPSADVGRYLKALAGELAQNHGLLSELSGALGGVDTEGVPAPWIEQVARELVESEGRAVLLVGSRQPAWVHALAHAVNEALGARDRTVRYFPATDPEQGNPLQDLSSLVEAVKGGTVSTLLMLGGNPVYDAPSDLGFGEVLATEGLTSIHLSMHRDETSQRCSWHVPRTHELEAWGDQRALDGTLSVQQPLIAPLYEGARSDIEMLGMVAGERNWRGHRLVRTTLRSTAPGTSSFERNWRRILHRGLVSDPPTRANPSLKTETVASAVSAAGGRAEVGPDKLEVVFAADYAMFDGRHANNPWMLELPHPMTRIAWDNPAQISPKTAEALGVEGGDIVKLSRQGGTDIEIAVTILPGHADWTVTLPLGWGRSHAGNYGNGCGFDVHPLRTTDGFHFATGVQASKTGRRHHLAELQTHDSMEGRPLAIDGTFQPVHTDDPRYKDAPSYQDDPKFTRYRSVTMSIPPLWETVDYSGRIKWGMTIDLSACTGCSACVIACQAENNIPSVGKQQAAIGRAMHWIRVDRYFVGEVVDDPLVAMQPVTCQHCEQAPCENVCPVNATAHSPEGLNDMAYNRCIGTRYCMNNCPYKVRRFNFLNWNGHLDKVANDMGGTYGDIPETHKMQKNPNVTMRFRGVMEKCTYCVQRIEAARIAARTEGRDFQDTDESPVTPACAQACPTQAITFGDLNNKRHTVTQMANLDRRYNLLAEVGTQPRTTYLGKIRNPNPAMLPGSNKKPHQAASQHGATEAEG
jgi:molybdopterin-containing oxidoreductase family iron-sulfur binding subunit